MKYPTRRISFVHVNYDNLHDMAAYMVRQPAELLEILDQAPGNEAMIPYFTGSEILNPTDTVTTETCTTCNVHIFSHYGPIHTYHAYLFHMMARHRYEYEREVIKALGFYYN